MANWLEAAFGLGDEAEPIAPPRRQPPEIKSFWCVVAQPTGAPGDLGETVLCHYIVEGGALTLCDEQGKGLAATDEHGRAGNTSHVLAPGDDPRRVASRLRRAAWQSESGRSAFNRPLHYQPLGFA
jgi:hypothetical protein